jgi:hypothetical protein
MSWSTAPIISATSTRPVIPPASIECARRSSPSKNAPGEGGDNYWIRIGSAWAHADGNGFNIQLETVPLDGRVALRIAAEKNK